jgi:hypothetical protein
MDAAQHISADVLLGEFATVAFTTFISFHRYSLHSLP